MADAPLHLRTHDLADLARLAFGPSRALAGIDRLRGGSKKGVYRLTLDNGVTGIAYVWNAEENYWPATATAHDPTDPFAPADGLDLFVAAHQLLTDAGVRVPGLILLDRTRAERSWRTCAAAPWRTSTPPPVPPCSSGWGPR